MKTEIARTLESVGILWPEALDRFLNNETLLLRMLGRFPQEESFALLCRALADGDVHAAFAAAHSLKGVAGNLSIQPLYLLAGEMTETLRAGRLQEATEQLPALQEQYDQTVQALRTLPL